MNCPDHGRKSTTPFPIDQKRTSADENSSRFKIYGVRDALSPSVCAEEERRPFFSGAAPPEHNLSRRHCPAQDEMSNFRTNNRIRTAKPSCSASTASTTAFVSAAGVRGFYTAPLRNMGGKDDGLHFELEGNFTQTGNATTESVATSNNNERRKTSPGQWNALGRPLRNGNGNDDKDIASRGSAAEVCSYGGVLAASEPPARSATEIFVPEPAKVEQTYVDGVEIGVADTRGRRPTMEDVFFVASHVTRAPRSQRILLFGVCDGHGGTEASVFVARNWPGILFGMLDLAVCGLDEDKMRVALRESVSACNDAFHREVIERQKMTVGTTLCSVAVVDGDVLYACNVGDSRAIAVGRDGCSFATLTEDHKPARAEERRRIEALGGFVSQMFGDAPRVLGCLAVSRSIGDFFLRPYLTHEPEISGPFRTSEISSVAIVCDGVTDVLENDDIAAIVSRVAPLNGPSAAALSIRNRAYECNSGDNITAMVVNICSF